MANELINNLDKIHTTPLGVTRIKRNLRLDIDDVVSYCIQLIKSDESIIMRSGKNWYIENGKTIITINAYSFTIITCHIKK